MRCTICNAPTNRGRVDVGPLCSARCEDRADVRAFLFSALRFAVLVGANEIGARFLARAIVQEFRREILRAALARVQANASAALAEHSNHSAAAACPRCYAARAILAEGGPE